jgi:hypothetical protein
MPQLSVMARRDRALRCTGGLEEQVAPGRNRREDEVDLAGAADDGPPARPVVKGEMNPNESLPISAKTVGAPRPSRKTSVDGQRETGDIAGLVGGEPQHCVVDVDRLDPGIGSKLRPSKPSSMSACVGSPDPAGTGDRWRPTIIGVFTVVGLPC